MRIPKKRFRTLAVLVATASVALATIAGPAMAAITVIWFFDRCASSRIRNRTSVSACWRRREASSRATETVAISEIG